MTRTAIVAISRRGAVLSGTLAASLDGDNRLYLDRRFIDGGNDVVPFDLPVRPLIQKLFHEYPRIVLFMPAGAAVRLLAPLLRLKGADPAVVCVDDAGRFAISLLSGHLGGADRLAQQVADILGATPVITSASHVTGTLAVDLLGQELGWRIEADSLDVTRASAAMINGEPVGIYQQAGEPDWWPSPWPDNLQVYSSLGSLAASSCAAALVISDQIAPNTGKGPGYQDALGDKPMVLYRPRSLVVGMGCRRGVPSEELEELLLDTFSQHNLALKSLRCIATAELKRDEPGLLRLAETYGVALQCYGSDALNSMFPPHPTMTDATTDETAASPGPTPSPAARRLLGLWGVSEPAALLGSGGEELLVTKRKSARATIAVARMNFSGARPKLATATQRSQS